MQSAVLGALACGLAVLTACTPASATDMQKFSMACLKSPDLLEMFAGNPVTPEQARQKFCGCLGEALGPKVTQKQADLMTAQVARSLTTAQKRTFEQDQALQDVSTATMNACLSSTGLTVRPRQAG